VCDPVGISDARCSSAERSSPLVHPGKNITVSSAFIDGALYLQESFLVLAVTAVSSNSTVLIDLLEDKELALQLATLQLTPTYREELSILANRTDINLGE
jgi:hypothetical protein